VADLIFGKDEYRKRKLGYRVDLALAQIKGPGVSRASFFASDGLMD
jgi:hypothetical protein